MGASGGIITIWNSSLFVGMPWFTDSFPVGVSFISTQSNEAWNLLMFMALALASVGRILVPGFSISIYPAMKIGCYWETSTSFVPQLIETNLVVMLLICSCSMKSSVHNL